MLPSYFSIIPDKAELKKASLPLCRRRVICGITATFILTKSHLQQGFWSHLLRGTDVHLNLLCSMSCKHGSMCFHTHWNEHKELFTEVKSYDPLNGNVTNGNKGKLCKKTVLLSTVGQKHIYSCLCVKCMILRSLNGIRGRRIDKGYLQHCLYKIQESMQ